MRIIWMIVAATLVTGILASCSTTAGCNCVTRSASGEKGASLDIWVNFDLPDTGAPEGYVGEVAYAELTFLSIKGEQGVQVNVCNQHRKLTAPEIDDLGPDLFAVPPGCTIHLSCASREGVSGGCDVEYQFRWLDK